jgi:hypothetical protein
MKAKTLSDEDRIAALEADVKALPDRIHLLGCFADVRHREKAGLTTDDIRRRWHSDPPIPEHGPV